jgi:hypothetical protein
MRSAFRIATASAPAAAANASARRRRDVCRACRLIRLVIACCVLGFVTARQVRGAVFPEAEPNNNKADANLVTGLVPGDSITGSVSQGDADYFRLRTAAAPPGIYRHRLTMNLPPGDGATLDASVRGVSRFRNVIEEGDVTAQQSASKTSLGGSGLVNQWYGFGKEERLFYRVNHSGGAGSVMYDVGYSSVPVTPVEVGELAPGSITISSRNLAHDTDTDLWVYDAAFNILAGNDNWDPNTHTAQTSELTHTFAAPGTYYLAISEFDLVAPADQSNTDGGFERIQLTPDPGFSDVILEGGEHSPILNLDVSVRFTDSQGTVRDAALFRADQLDVVFARFTVLPEPAALSACVLLAVLGRQPERRRARAHVRARS